MASRTDGGPPPLNQTRQVTIDALCEHFANDVMPVEEFERRVDLAHKASTVDDLKGLLQDLPGANLPAPAGSDAPLPAAPPRREFSVTSAAHVKERGFAIACLGGATRRGKWTPARTNFAVAIMGGVELDFREAVLGPGVTEVQVFAMWGGVEIIVPPGLHVESQGIGIMGGFDHYTDVDAGDMDAPTLRITGAAVMGGVEIVQRYPGETPREARRRRKLERKERRRLRSGE